MMSHEKKLNNLFFYWLLVSLSLIFFMIFVGGLTRLTNSGLSITEWELFKGIFPPLSDEAWNSYFDLYKKIPQYEILNYSMTLSEFKVIFYWEYGHRILGRIIGIFFLIPLLYFQFIKKVNFKLLIPYYIIMLLILIQGFVGWYMVKSGLVEDVTVSHYRLSLHLSLAIIIISIIFWELLNLKNNNRKFFFKSSTNNFSSFFLIILILVQVILGAFVSGLDAGKIYQSWPLMNNSYFPDDVDIINFISLVNFDNESLIQFYHRNFAYFITAYILLLSYINLRKRESVSFKPNLILLFVLFIQIALGIFTLLSNLNIALASAHQIFSVIIVLSAINLHYSIIK